MALITGELGDLLDFADRNAYPIRRTGDMGDAVNNFQPDDPKQEQNIPEPSASKVFGDEFMANVNESTTGIELGIAKALWPSDRGYNAIQDPSFLARGPEFVKQYRDYMSDSPNPNATQGLLSHIDAWNQLDTELQKHPVAGFIGGALGGLIDPTSAIFGSVLGGAGRLARVALNSAYFIGAGALVGYGNYANDPNTDKSSILSTALYSGAIGGALSMFGSTAGKALPLIEEAFNPKIDNIFVKDANIKIDTGIDGKINVPAPQDKELNEENVNAIAKADYHGENQLITSTPYKWALNLMGHINWGEDLAKSPEQFESSLGELLGGSSSIKEKNLEGIASNPSVFLEREQRLAAQNMELKNNLGPAFSDFKDAGGNLSQEAFMKQAEKSAMGIYDGEDKAVVKAGQGIRQYLDKYQDILKDEGFLQQDAKTDPNFFPHYYDMNKITKDYNGFRTTLMDHFAKNPEESELGSKIDPQKSADSVLKNLREFEGTSANIRFKATSLKARTLNLTNEEASPWIKNFTGDSLAKYTHDVETQRILAKHFQTTSEVTDKETGDSIVKYNRDYKKNIHDKINDGYQSLLKDQGNKSAESLLKTQMKNRTAINNALDIFTGQFDHTPSSIKTGLNIAMHIGYLTKLGGVALMQLSHGGRMLTMDEGLLNKLGHRLGIVKDVMAPYILKMSDEDKAIMHLKAEDINMSGVKNFADISNAGFDMSTKIERGLATAASKFSYVNFYHHIHTFARETTLNSVFTRLSKSLPRLTNGLVDPKSFEGIELARMGIDKNLAQKILKNLDESGQEQEVKGVKIRFANFSKWSDTKASMQTENIINSYVDRIILRQQPGDKFFFMSKIMGAAMGQFKGFMLADLAKGLLSNIQEAGMGGQYTRQAAHRFWMAMVLGSLSGVASDAITGRKTSWNPAELAYYGFSRGGFFPGLDYVNNILDQHGVGIASHIGLQKRSPMAFENSLTPFMGPSWQFVGSDLPNALHSVKNVITGHQRPKDMANMLRVMPGSNLFYTGRIMKHLADQD